MRLNGHCIWSCQRREITLEQGSGEKRRKKAVPWDSNLDFQRVEKVLEKDIREAAKEAHGGPRQRSSPNGK